MKVIDESHGRVHVFCPASQDAPPPNVRVAVGNSSEEAWPNPSGPVCTSSTTDVIVKVSWAVSDVFEIPKSHVYAAPTYVGLSQPLVKAIPCMSAAWAHGDQINMVAAAAGPNTKAKTALARFPTNLCLRPRSSLLSFGAAFSKPQSPDPSVAPPLAAKKAAQPTATARNPAAARGSAILILLSRSSTISAPREQQRRRPTNLSSLAARPPPQCFPVYRRNPSNSVTTARSAPELGPGCFLPVDVASHVHPYSFSARGGPVAIGTLPNVAHSSPLFHLVRLWGANIPSVSGRAASGKLGPPNVGGGAQTRYPERTPVTPSC